MVQDSIQSFHWTGQQSTVHPFIVYYKEDGVLKTISSAVISDRLKHDTLSVFAFKSLLIQEIQRRGIPVDHIHYVSDGSGAQYKNCKNFLDLCMHQEDFGISADWFSGVNKELQKFVSFYQSTTFRIFKLSFIKFVCTFSTFYSQ